MKRALAILGAGLSAAACGSTGSSAAPDAEIDSGAAADAVAETETATETWPLDAPIDAPAAHRGLWARAFGSPYDGRRGRRRISEAPTTAASS